MAGNSMDDIGSAFVRSLFGMLGFDITEYCNAGIDEAYEYCIQEFKKACEESGIEWEESWEDILYG